MRTYEALYIIRPELAEDAIQTMVEGVDKLIAEEGGTIVRSEILGKRRLAYPVKKCTEGVYVLVRFDSESAAVDALERYYRLAEDVIRYLVILFEEKTKRLEEEQQRRTQAQLEARATSGPRRRDEGSDDRDDRGPRPRRTEAPARAAESVAAGVGPSEASAKT